MDSKTCLQRISFTSVDCDRDSANTTYSVCGRPAITKLDGVPTCESCVFDMLTIFGRKMTTESKQANTGTERRRQILAEIEKCVCRDRQNTYGDAEDNFRQIARYWSEWKGVEFTALDVAAMMVFVKLARMKTSPFNLDNWIDAAGYAVCGGGIVSKANENQIVDPSHLSDKSTGA